MIKAASVLMCQEIPLPEYNNTKDFILSFSPISDSVFVVLDVFHSRHSLLSLSAITRTLTPKIDRVKWPFLKFDM